MQFKTKTSLLLIAAFISISLLLIRHRIFNDHGSNNKRPNILLISLDACRADHLSCYGYYRKTSPFIDELASRGIRYENAFINTLATPSSHATIFTSLYQETHEVGKNNPFFVTLPNNIILMQEIFQKKGYITLAVTDTEIFQKMGFERGFMELDFTEEMSDIESGTEKLFKLIRKYSKEAKPIFAFFHTYEIHFPFEPPQNYRTFFGKYESEFEPTPSQMLKFVNNANGLKNCDLEFLRALYDCEIRYTDDILRNLFDELDRIGFFDNSLVIITSDHGEEFGDHGGLGHRGLLYDELIHVPLIFVGNFVPKGMVETQMVSSIDIMPTILNYAGIENNVPLEGKNLLSNNHNPKSEEDMVFSQFETLRYSIRTKNWKIIENQRPHTIELFNLLKDPGEKHNVANDHPEIKEKFLSILSKWKASRLKIKELETEKIQYSEETLEKLRSLGYLH